MTTFEKKPAPPGSQATGVSDNIVRADELSVLADIAYMIRTILDEIEDGYEYGPETIAMETRFHRDLELESIDLVTLAGLLKDRYENQVNFAEFLADMEFDEIIELTVGRLVEHVVHSLGAAEVG
ncbi:acyl carrier protein [Streptomyces sp. NPDC093982]|uniref:acyl carrier protein n=1 Tax=Streptomyces sp. NPDC093982 TaxID=3155077 RepID=UPI003445798A